MKSDLRNVDEILDRHLPSASKDELEQVGSTVLARLRLKSALPAQEAITDSVLASSLRWQRFVIATMAAALLLAVFVGVPMAWRRVGSFAVVETADRGLQRVEAGASADGRAIHAGDRISKGQIIRSNDGGGTALVLKDGSRIEMRSKSELAIEAANDGIRIRLNTGGVIVTAAKQRTGHLYVQTKDVTVSVVGTVFFVNVEEAGSRVAVVQGEVHVQRGQSIQKLYPGEQIATQPSMPSIPVAEEIAWSRIAEAHLAVMQRATTIESPQLVFEVSSVKVHDPGDHSPGSAWFLPGGRFTATNMSLGQLIRIAYNVRAGQVSGGPGWINSEGSDRYDIVAHASDGSFPAGQPDRVLVDRIRLMLQALLAERFSMTVKREVKELPVYALVVTKGEAKLQKSNRDCNASPGACHGFIGGRGRGFTAQAMDMSDLADALMFWTDRPVQDRTGIQGTFDFEVPPWTSPSQLSPQTIADGREPPPDPARPDLFTTLQESIGLKLEAQTGPVESLIIESAERPSGN
jgi:uncharacterized protein (TIGR03435 family)